MTETGGRARDALQAAIDAVYAVFTDYGAPKTLHAAPKHDVPKVLQRLRSAPLRQLAAEDLGPFAGSALYTIGGVPDYKHFLPRILELAIGEQVHLGLEAWLIARKLVYAAWTKWPAAEVAAIRTLFAAAWQVLRYMAPEDGDAPDWLYGNAMIGEDIALRLRDWHPSVANGGLSQAAELVSVLERIGDSVWDDAPAPAIAALFDWSRDPDLSQAFRDGLPRVAPDERWEIEQALKVLGRG